MQLRLRRTAVLLCMLCAFAQGSKAVAQDQPWKLGANGMLYTDSDNVTVVSSEVAVQRNLDDSGSQIAASGIVDVTSAASVDVVSHATTRFREVRVEANLGGSYAIGDTLPGLRYRISVEPDYVSHGLNANVSRRLGSADTVLAASYFLSLDTVGRHETTFSQWSQSLRSHTVDLSLAQNVDTETVIRGVYTLTVQDGYMEKPYRYVPLFDAAGVAKAAADQVSLNLGSFNSYRLGSRPAEEVPDLRVRHALGLRALRFLPAIDGSLRLDYRFYVDSWQLTAHTLELALTQRLAAWLRYSVYGRGYTQGDAYFWKRVYVVHSELDIPRYRSVDRQLSRYWTGTLGTRADLVFDKLQVFAQADVAYSHFSDFLYLTHRWVLITQLGLEWTP